MTRYYYFFILILISAGCHKKSELLTGDIVGRVTVYNKAGILSTDYSGIKVNLLNDTSIINNSFTDEYGQYLFSGISYGKYKIELQKDNYIEQQVDYSFFHVGGYSPTIRDAVIYEIPDYKMTIDSILLFSSEFRLKLYLKIDGTTIIPFDAYRVIGFCSTSPEVSIDNYLFTISGRVLKSPLYTPFDASGEFSSNVWKLNTPDTYYLIFYLLAYGQNFSTTVNKKALGKPSNVISFKWE